MERQFNLVFEPSGDVLRAFITQDSGKAIESVEKQTFLGEWILRGVFQLKEYEPLTVQKMKEVGLNGVRMYKLIGSEDIHLQFIWIDEDNLPEDYVDDSRGNDLILNGQYRLFDDDSVAVAEKSDNYGGH